MKDEDLYKFLPELKRPAAVMKKYKCIPGSIKLEISPCPEDVKSALSPELAKVDPYPSKKIHNKCGNFCEAPLFLQMTTHGQLKRS